MTVNLDIHAGPSVVPYSLDTIQALRAHWRLPYSYVPTVGVDGGASMAFSPLLNDENWKGEPDSMIFLLQDLQFID